MSVKSTYGIPRSVAKEVIIGSLIRLSNERLAEMLESLPESEYRNYCIDGQGYSNKTDTFIATAEEFFNLKDE